METILALLSTYNPVVVPLLILGLLWHGWRKDKKIDRIVAEIGKYEEECRERTKRLYDKLDEIKSDIGSMHPDIEEHESNSCDGIKEISDRIDSIRSDISSMRFDIQSHEDGSRDLTKQQICDKIDEITSCMERNGNECREYSRDMSTKVDHVESVIGTKFDEARNDVKTMLGRVKELNVEFFEKSPPDS